MKLNLQLFADEDGKIVIGTVVDTTGVEEGIQDIEEMDDTELDIFLKAKGVEVPEEELQAIADELSNNLMLSPDTKQFDIQIAQIKTKLLSLKAVMEKATEIGLDDESVMNMMVKVEQLNNKLIQLENQKQKIESQGFFTKAGNTISDIVKKVSKWGLMLIGIRTAYSMISSTANKLAQDNDELAAKLQQIKGSLTNLLAPAVELIVNLVWRLLAYLNVISKSFLGIDLFAKSNKSVKSTLGSAQKLRKTLAGFDEMNILNDNTPSGGGGGGAKTPDIEPPDTSGFEEAVENIKLMWVEVTEINRGEMKEMLLEQDKTWGVLKLGWFDTVQGIARAFRGLADIFKGVYEIIYGIATGNNEAIEYGVNLLVLGIKKILLGLVQAIIGIAEMIGGVVWGLIKTVIDWVYNSLLKPIGNAFSNMWNAVVVGATGVVTKVKTSFTNVVNFFKTGVQTVISLFKSIGTKVGDAIGSAFKSVVNSVLSAVENILNKPINAINKLLDKINAVPGINLSRLSTIRLPRLAKGGIVNLPSKGVPVGNAYAGESGAEGVIPLTDSQQMELLGEAIGRYITINANITNTMNGRVISRELQKINNENSFASNR